DESQKELIEHWLDRFDTDIAPRLARLRAQIIHNDFNPENLLVNPSAPNRISGIIDFGDMVHSPLITDLAVAAGYQVLTDDDPTTAIAELAAAYNGTVPLESAEIEVLPDLAACRLVQSLLVGAWRARHHTDNTDYILSYSDSSWDALQRFSALDGKDVVEATRVACSTKSIRFSAPHDLPALLDRRRRRLGSGMRLSYNQPLHAVAGDGVWLIDAAGVRHLDAYNNVPHVGHSHPTITAAIAHQSATLNTNTRYLVDGVLDYADRLAGLFPDDLSVVMFANSGSEANDLAWRIARTVTGHDGMIITRHAYHGATNLTIATSPEEIGLENLESWVATVPAPDPRLPSGNHLEQALSQLSTANHRPAAFACDTVFSSDGIFEPVAGYFSSMASQIRAAGGLFIADEVQAGFGRVGECLWGFAADDFAPDIVTIGKPMGNGHPIAAIVTTPAIADAFIEKGYYFSTFAGNPVSTAAAMAVLDVMEEEGLPAKAHRVGSYLRGQLQDLAQGHPSISEVRGPGMFIGVELAIDGRPDPEGATRVANEMRNRRVLIGRTGIHGNVLKIRPPLAFDESHADLLVDTLEGVLADR
ncbi:MAG: aminotransferase class III-fold pyridoxal phosphate-dependent enzyme, partial [Acidimicrobiia bacterium]|nr:aminotransferase class III-fold pyridoxal phosphate-dependent enzyme [Acidimicrobiia bacterium]